MSQWYYTHVHVYIDQLQLNLLKKGKGTVWWTLVKGKGRAWWTLIEQLVVDVDTCKGSCGVNVTWYFTWYFTRLLYSHYSSHIFFTFFCMFLYLQTKHKTSGNIYDSPRAMAKLLKEARILKTVLSANTNHNVQVHVLE